MTDEMKTVSNTDFDFKIVYATQTGNAKAIAERLAEIAAEKALKTHVHCISEVNVPPFAPAVGSIENGKVLLDGSATIAFICSSTGDGDPPDSAQKLVRFLKQTKKRSDDNFSLRLSGLRYAFLCLGDTNYSTFCGGGRQFDSLLHEFGARRFLDTRYADDGVGLDSVVEPWLEEVLSAIGKLKLEIPDNENSSSSGKHDRSTNGELETLIDRCQLNSTDKEKDQDGLVESQLDDSRFAAFCEIVSKRPPKEIPATNSSIPPSIPLEFKNWHLGLTADQSASVVADSTREVTPAFERKDQVAPSARPTAPFEKWRLIDGTKLCEIADRRYFEIWLERGMSLVGGPIMHFKPGDAVSVAFCNSEFDVDEVLDAFDWRRNCLADSHLSLVEVTNDGIASGDDSRLRKTPDFQSLLAFLRGPKRVTIRKCLRRLINLRAVPPVTFLRYFVATLTQKMDHHDNASAAASLREELNVLRTLVADETAYRELLLEKRLTLVDFVTLFKRSCNFVLHTKEKQLDATAFFAWLVYTPKHLNGTPSRFFSVANATGADTNDPTRLRIVFNTFRTDADYPFTVSRHGVCTHFLESKIEKKNDVYVKLRFRVADTNTKRNEKAKVKHFPFRLPEDDDSHLQQETDTVTPCGLVLVAIGTGVAPLIGFIEQRIAAAAKTISKPPPIELFFGVRHRELADAFFNHLLLNLRDQYARVGGSLHTHVAVSSSSSNSSSSSQTLAQQTDWLDGAHVQDALRAFWPCVGETLAKHNGHVYVCGDDGSRGLLQSIIDLVDQLSQSSESQWRVDVAELQKDGRFRQDCWF